LTSTRPRTYRSLVKPTSWWISWATLFCSACRQFFSFFPGGVHILQNSSDDVHPVFPWPSIPAFSCSLSIPAVLASILSACPGHLRLLSFVTRSNFCNPSLLYDLSHFVFPWVRICGLLPVFYLCDQ